MKPATGILVAVATYNEIENLPDLVTAVFQYAPDAHLLVIDDNSPDGTGQWCEEQASEESRLSCLHRARKLGLGTAAVAGFQFAIDHSYEFVLTMDADFSHDPRHIPSIQKRIQAKDGAEVDVVIGSRYAPGGAIEGWSWYRRVMSRAINLYSRMLLGLAIADCSGAFRCYRTSALQKLNLDELESKGYSYLEEILWRLEQTGARCVEVPITFVDRQRGDTKINWREAATAVFLIFRFGLRHRFGRRRESKQGKPSHTRRRS